MVLNNRTATEVGADQWTKYLAKLKIDVKNVFGWVNKDEGMKFWNILLHPDILTI